MAPAIIFSMTIPIATVVLLGPLFRAPTPTSVHLTLIATLATPPLVSVLALTIAPPRAGPQHHPCPAGTCMGQQGNGEGP